MKKIVSVFTTLIISIISYGQPQNAEMKANDRSYLATTVCNNTLDISTTANWIPVGSIPTTITTFAGHSNWIAINNPQTTTYQFKRKFYIGRAGTYTVNVKGMGDNKIVLTVDNTTTIIDYDVTVASGFNTPATGKVNVEMSCGVHELNATITNHGGPAGFYLDGNITSRDGCVSDGKVICEVIKEVCRCPQGWLSNTSNQDGGITTDRKCKKMFCRLEGIKPLPSNGTVIGSTENPWGFTWADGIYAWGTKENGGAAICKKEWVAESTNTGAVGGKKQ